MILGIIGPSDSSKKIEEYLKDIDKEVEIKLYIREKAAECIEVIATCEEECDAIIFTGCGVAAVKSKYEVKLNGFPLGIGIGTTAYQAETNGYKALKRCIDSKDFNIYLVDDEIIKGPLGTDSELSYSLIASDERLIKISEKTGLSCESVAKII